MKKREEILFDEKKHHYWLASNPDIVFTSGTGFIKQFTKPFNMDGASFGTAKGITRELKENDTYCPEKLRIFTKLFGDKSDSYFSLMKDNKQPFSAEYVKDVWKEKGLVARSFGTEVHNTLEKYIKGENVSLKEEDYKYQQSLPKIISGIKWLSTEQDCKFYPEFKMYCEELWLCGTADLLRLNLDGTYSLLDWKTNLEIKSVGYGKLLKPFNHLEDCELVKYSLQMYFYKYLLEKHYDISIKDCIILHLQDEDCVEIPCLDMETTILDMINIHQKKVA